MSRSSNGFVLVSVLWVVALLTVITISYHYRARLEVRAARYSLDSAQARMTARAALERGILELRNKTVFDALRQDPTEAPRAPSTHLGQSWAQVGDLYRDGGLLTPGDDFVNDVAQYHIEDMERLININHVSDEMMAALPGISLPVARRIHYRVTGDADAQVNGQRFQDISELRSIRGLDDNAWYGDGDEPGLRDILTTYGDGHINVNTAPREVLASLPEIEESVVDDLLHIRSGPDGITGTRDDIGFSDWQAFSEQTGISGDGLLALQQFCKFNSSCFKITAVATRRGGMIHSECSAIVEVPDGSDVARILSWSEESLGSP